MSLGSYKLAMQSGQRGYYGEVDLAVEATDRSGEVQVEFSERCAKDWRAGASFGVDYILDQLPLYKLYPAGATVRIDRIQGHPVDTNSVVIAYVAAEAMMSALGIEARKRPSFDGATGLFTFPK